MSEMDKEDWTFVKLVIQKHWKAGTLFIILGIVAVVGAILTLFFHIDFSNIGNGGQWTIGEFSIKDIIFWFLWLILWEVLFVVIPAAIVIGGLGYYWWSNLDEKEKDQFKQREKKEKKSEAASGVFGFFIFIAFLILTIIGGTFDTPIGTIPYVYWIEVWLWSAFWVLLIIGLPALIGGILYLRKKLREV